MKAEVEMMPVPALKMEDGADSQGMQEAPKDGKSKERIHP